MRCQRGHVPEHAVPAASEGTVPPSTAPPTTASQPVPEADPSAAPGIVPDDLPRTGLFAEPIEVARLTVRDPERLEGGRVQVGFKAIVRDADGKRCPELAVEARIEGPERTAEGMAWTNLLGSFEFQMEGPPGTYRFEVLDVAAGGLAFDRAASELTAHVEA